ncbi:uncharacterized protein J8A68_002420 [[Candida] subhashii]|uniref:Hyphally-regulated cell wall protein N-terminal domain-containing protein n=1 Tax=[Candida] subhashii TaxID=561895 RepID=A0A8J5QRN2_9ASCO|nr:uncharacterized protein J8A68_002420 [[Candida] subhashii]KAG7664042.1 hypothetical protein J8A68_002420 [[Candida] subhashii]
MIIQVIYYYFLLSSLVFGLDIETEVIQRGGNFEVRSVNIHSCGVLSLIDVNIFDIQYFVNSAEFYFHTTIPTHQFSFASGEVVNTGQFRINTYRSLTHSYFYFGAITNENIFTIWIADNSYSDVSLGNLYNYGSFSEIVEGQIGSLDLTGELFNDGVICLTHVDFNINYTNANASGCIVLHDSSVWFQQDPSGSTICFANVNSRIRLEQPPCVPIVIAGFGGGETNTIEIKSSNPECTQIEYVNNSLLSISADGIIFLFDIGPGFDGNCFAYKAVNDSFVAIYYNSPVHTGNTCKCDCNQIIPDDAPGAHPEVITTTNEEGATVELTITTTDGSWTTITFTPTPPPPTPTPSPCPTPSQSLTTTPPIPPIPTSPTTPTAPSPIPPIPTSPTTTPSPIPPIPTSPTSTPSPIPPTTTTTPSPIPTSPTTTPSPIPPIPTSPTTTPSPIPPTTTTTPSPIPPTTTTTPSPIPPIPTSPTTTPSPIPPTTTTTPSPIPPTTTTTPSPIPPTTTTPTSPIPPIPTSPTTTPSPIPPTTTTTPPIPPPVETSTTTTTTPPIPPPVETSTTTTTTPPIPPPVETSTTTTPSPIPPTTPPFFAPPTTITTTIDGTLTTITLPIGQTITIDPPPIVRTITTSLHGTLTTLTLPVIYEDQVIITTATLTVDGTVSTVTRLILGGTTTETLPGALPSVLIYTEDGTIITDTLLLPPGVPQPSTTMVTVTISHLEAIENETVPLFPVTTGLLPEGTTITIPAAGPTAVPTLELRQVVTPAEAGATSTYAVSALRAMIVLFVCVLSL